MKKFKIILILIVGTLSGSCNLDEDPIFLDATLYETPQSAKAALDGIYTSLTSYNAQERRYFVVNGFSGLFNTKKNGNNVNNPNNKNLYSLKPIYDADSEAVWGGMYGVIAQANSAIKNIEPVDNPTTNDELFLNDIAGQAYFIRAWSYFELVRLFGDVPLWLDLPNSESIHKETSSQKEVYAQIIKDATQATSLMNGKQGAGYPKQEAGNMLLAKLFMTLATNSELQDASLSESDYWQMAYDEAIEVYGQYSLVADYSSLFTIPGANSSESIFELQISQDASNSQMGRNYTPSGYKATQAFGWFKVHASVYDDHASKYPNDPRLGGTYLSEYINAKNGKLIKTYPANPGRANYNAGHPFFFKFAEKDQSSTNQYGGQNIIIYRYADLLIMLAEISNELQNGQQLGYITELLNRVGMAPHAGYIGSKDEFRDAVMNEYRFELLGEGEDAHNNKRRGFNYFLANTLLKHNNNPKWKAGVDLTLNTDESQVMTLPIPLIEINTNELID